MQPGKAANMLEETTGAQLAIRKSPGSGSKPLAQLSLRRENLAKDFGDTGHMMSAWMASHPPRQYCQWQI
jgi:hypothetical protein